MSAAIPIKIAQLKKLAAKGESENLEFKASTASLGSAMQTVCAYLNNEGGTVIFGIRDDGTIVGQSVSDKTRKEIGQELKKIEPHAKIDVIYVPVGEEKQAIVFIAHDDDQGPYWYDGRTYTRKQTTTMRMSSEEYSYLYHKNNPTVWERTPNKRCKINDLNHKQIREVIGMAVVEKRLPASAKSASIHQILSNLGLIIEDHPTNAAIIAFCKKQEKQFFQSTVKLARFMGTNKKEFLDNKMYQGNVFDLFHKIMDFLSFTIPVAARIEEGKIRRVETPMIPDKVLREAVANALIHRDYSHGGGSVAVAVYDDRINITNIGSLIKGIKINQLSEVHPSVQRNPLIANLFYIYGTIEKWGRGTLDMIEDCKNAEIPIPVFEELGNHFSVTIPFCKPIRDVVYIGQADTYKLSNRQKEILTILQAGPLNRNQIMEKMNNPLTDRALQRELFKLKSKDIIRSEGKTRKILWLLMNN